MEERVLGHSDCKNIYGLGMQMRSANRKVGYGVPMHAG